MKTKSFRVISISSNTNSFGLNQCIMVAKDGTVVKACANSLNMPKRGADVEIPMISDDQYNFASKGFEIPEVMEKKAPKGLIADVYSKK